MYLSLKFPPPPRPQGYQEIITVHDKISGALRIPYFNTDSSMSFDRTHVKTSESYYRWFMKYGLEEGSEVLLMLAEKLIM